ncbi:eotaxin-like [Scyliorhinus canicula]|uniref:eotaxin-like n=1 Tax=Scyliorhinus canicula TaxID=7830 RepID=UPI0018F30E36|nr:eotaxin-like [Scyliorhinus canicula]
MKTALCVAAAVLGTLVICLIQDVAASPAGTVTLECCEHFKPTPIIHKRLVSYKETIGCSTPAVVFTNRRNKKICAKASEKWVQAAVRFLNNEERRRH